MSTSKLFTPEQIKALRDEFESISRIDPNSPAYRKFRDALDSLPNPILDQLISEKIPFVSSLCRNTKNRRSLSK